MSGADADPDPWGAVLRRFVDPAIAAALAADPDAAGRAVVEAAVARLLADPEPLRGLVPSRLGAVAIESGLLRGRGGTA